MELQGASNSASHVTESDHVTSTSDHVTTEIDRTECRTVLDLYRCLVQSCLDGHFTAVYRPSNSDKRFGRFLISDGIYYDVLIFQHNFHQK